MSNKWGHMSKECMSKPSCRPTCYSLLYGPQGLSCNGVGCDCIANHHKRYDSSCVPMQYCFYR